MLVMSTLRPRPAAGDSAARAMRGFTLIELVFTITLVAILAALAAPSFRQFILSQRVKNASFDLVAALTLARSEAISRNTSVDVAKSGSGWSSGWTVSTVVAGTPTTLLAQNSFAGVAITDSASLGTLTYGKDGRTTTAGTKFAICPPAPVIAGVAMRCVSVGLSGVPSSTPLNNPTPTLTTAGSCLPCS